MVKVNPKWKNIFIDHPKNDGVYRDLPKAANRGKSNNVCASSKFVLYHVESSGGVACLLKMNKVGRYPQAGKFVPGHKGSILESQFCPHNDNIVATAGSDGTMIITFIDESLFTQDGTALGENLTDPLVTYEAADQKGITNLCWSPTVQNLIALSGAGKEINFVDANNGSLVPELDVIEISDPPQSMCWSYNGMYICCTVCTGSNHTLLVVDPRSPDQKIEIKTGMKKTAVFWAGTNGHVGVIGVDSQTQKRIAKVWAISDPDVETGTLLCKSQDVTNGSGLIHCFFDAGRNICWNYGRGESMVQGLDYQVKEKNGKKTVILAAMINGTSTAPNKGGCFLRDTGLNVTDCEAARFLAVRAGMNSQKAQIVPLPLQVPRKKKGWLPDLFPDVPGNKPVMQISDFVQGQTCDGPELRTLNPDAVISDDGSVTIAKKMPYNELEKQYNRLLAAYKTATGQDWDPSANLVGAEEA